MSKPYLHQNVSVRLPGHLAPQGIHGIGVVSDLGDDTEAYVFVYPTMAIPQQMMVRVPHKSKGSKALGWWEAAPIQPQAAKGGR